jgi:hypothetical protein
MVSMVLPGDAPAQSLVHLVLHEVAEEAAIAPVFRFGADQDLFVLAGHRHE